MMKPVNITCPPNAWPKNFTGQVCLGIQDVEQGKNTLWLVFDVAEGMLTQVAGLVTETKKVPDEIEALQPTLLAIASRQVWSLLTTDKKAFHARVAKGGVHLSGVFREFGRLTPRLLALAESAGIWSAIDTVVSELQE